MKSTGIVRKVDELGRIVNEKDSLEIYVDGNHIILKKYEPACIFCNSATNVVSFKGRNVCAECINQLSDAK